MVDASAFGRFLVIPIGVGWFWAISDYFMIYTIWFMIYAIYSFQLYSYHLKDLFLGNFLNYWFFQSFIFIPSTYSQQESGACFLCKHWWKEYNPYQYSNSKNKA